MPRLPVTGNRVELIVGSLFSVGPDSHPMN
jgi:hypothetical protein